MIEHWHFLMLRVCLVRDADLWLILKLEKCLSEDPGHGNDLENWSSFME